MTMRTRRVRRLLVGTAVIGALVTAAPAVASAGTQPAGHAATVTGADQSAELSYLVGVDFVDAAGAVHSYSGGLSVAVGPRDEAGNEGLNGRLVLQPVNRKDPRLPALEVRGASGFGGDRATVSLVARTADRTASEVIVTLKGVTTGIGFTGSRPGDVWLAGTNLSTWRSGTWSAVQE